MALLETISLNRLTLLFSNDMVEKQSPYYRVRKRNENRGKRVADTGFGHDKRGRGTRERNHVAAENTRGPPGKRRETTTAVASGGKRGCAQRSRVNAAGRGRNDLALAARDRAVKTDGRTAANDGWATGARGPRERRGIKENR